MSSRPKVRRAPTPPMTAPPCTAAPPASGSTATLPPPPASAATSSGPIITTADDIRAYRHIILPNQMQCLLISDPRSDKIAACMTVPAGTHSDPVDLGGLSTLLRKCILYGQKDSFRKYLSENNGSMKSITSSSRTSFTFDANCEILCDALAGFASLFVEPTISLETVDTTVEPGCNEDQGFMLNQLHQYFRSESAETQVLTIDLPLDNSKLALCNARGTGLDIDCELKKFYDSFYSANLMRLVVSSKVSLNELEEIVTASFTPIANMELSLPPTHPYDNDLCQKVVKMASDSPGCLVTINWPVICSIEEQIEVASCKYLIYLFNLDHEGSICGCLKKRGWGLNVSAGEADRNSQFCSISINMELTMEGQDNFEDACGIVLKYIKMLRKANSRRFLFDEMEASCEKQFKSRIQSSPLEIVEQVSSNILLFPPTHWLVGSSVPTVYSGDARDKIRYILNQLTTKNIRIMWVSRKFEGCSVESVPSCTLEGWGAKVCQNELYLPKSDALTAKPTKVPILGGQKQMRNADSKKILLVPHTSQHTRGIKQQECGQVMDQVLPAIHASQVTQDQQEFEPVMEQALDTRHEKVILETEKDTIFEKKDRVCIIFDERMLLHVPPRPHVENPKRISAIYERLKKDNILQRCDVYNSEIAKLNLINEVHEDDYILRVLGKQKILGDRKDMYLCDDSTDAIRLAAGGVMKACRMVSNGTHKHAFAVVRPPGHHARIKMEGGFCFINNISVAAKYLINNHHKEKILILDWDIHFGDGTEEIFCTNNQVLFISLHRHPDFFPKDKLSKVRGAVSNIGEGNGKGFTCNFCWSEPGVMDDDFYAAMDYVVLPLAQEFDPDIILISGGFDAAKGDLVGDSYLTKVGYATALYKLLQLKKGIVIALEGGYLVDDSEKLEDSNNLGRCSSSCVKVLCGDFSEVEHNNKYQPMESTWNTVLKLRSLLAPYWECLRSEIPADILARRRIKHPKPKKAPKKAPVH